MFRKNLIVFLFVMWFLIATSWEVWPQTTVVGQDNAAKDIQAVQAAVDQGGTVLLKGVFDFGEKGQVRIGKDVKLLGEKKEAQYLTKIKGGYWTFYAPLPTQLPIEAPGPKIEIRDIHFEGAVWSPIVIIYSSGVSIIGNRIAKVRPFSGPEVAVVLPSGNSVQQAIVCSSFFARKYQPGVIKGTLIISDNDIDLSNDIPEKTMSQGVFIMWTTGIKAEVSGNTIVNCSRNSIEILDNYKDKDGNGEIVIQGNKIITAETGIPIPLPQTPNGIVAGWLFDQTVAADMSRNIKYSITKNTIIARGKTSMGIALLTLGAIVQGNEIVVGGGEASGIVVWGAKNELTQNKVRGNGKSAIAFSVFKKLAARETKCQANDLSQFKASMADIMLTNGADNNVFENQNGSVINMGKGNIVGGLKTVFVPVAHAEEKVIPIRDFKDIAGTWEGKVDAPTWSTPMTCIINEDGTGDNFVPEDSQIFAFSDKGRFPLKRDLVDGKMRYKNLITGSTSIVTLYEDGGKRLLKSLSEDGTQKGVFEPATKSK
jgi:hypothetical protein